MAKVLVVGCGDLGGEIARLLDDTGHEVIGVRASNKSLSANIQVIQADVTHPTVLSVLENLKPEVLIYCVAAGTQTDESYKTVYVDGLKNVLATQASNHRLLHVFFVSSSRVYGETCGEVLNENTPAIPADFGGKRLLEAESLLKHLPCKATSMRLSGIYGRGRLYLANLAKDPGRWPRQNSWSNRIHRDDAACFIVFLCEKVLNKEPVEDCYIVTDDRPTQQYEVLIWLAREQGFDIADVNVPSAHGGKRLSNQRLRDTGFQLHYPDYQAGYRHVLQSL